MTTPCDIPVLNRAEMHYADIADRLLEMYEARIEVVYGMCGHCGGDPLIIDGELQCMQCGRVLEGMK